MEKITKKIICDCCGAEIDFIVSRNIYPETSEKPIKISIRRCITDHGEDWIPVDLCRECEDNFKMLWDTRAKHKEGV